MWIFFFINLCKWGWVSVFFNGHHYFHIPPPNKPSIVDVLYFKNFLRRFITVSGVFFCFGSPLPLFADCRWGLLLFAHTISYLKLTPKCAWKMRRQNCTTLGKARKKAVMFSTISARVKGNYALDTSIEQAMILEVHQINFNPYSFFIDRTQS
jgi:hypothetical protein